MITKQVTNRYNKKVWTVRQMTLEEVLDLSYGEHIWFICSDGKLGRAKVNGAVRRWKRNPDRFVLPLKYGLYEYATFTNSDIDRLVIPI